jgi:transposase-like protein
MVAIVDKDRKCRAIARMIDSGMGVTESCRELGISEKTFYRWRKEQQAEGPALRAAGAARS